MKQVPGHLPECCRDPAEKASFPAVHPSMNPTSPAVRETFALELKILNRFQCLWAVNEGEAGDVNHDAGTDNEDLIENVSTT